MLPSAVKADELSGPGLQEVFMSLGALSRAQPAYHLVNDEFSDHIEELELGLPEVTENYRYGISVAANGQVAQQWGVANSIA